MTNARLSSTSKRAVLAVPLILACSLLAGCLNYETYEQTITRGAEGQAHVTVVEFGNISAGADTADVDPEFRDLVNYIEGDDFLVSYMEAGMYVKSRRLVTRDGKVYGRIEGLSKGPVSEQNRFETKDGKVSIEFEKSGGLPVVLQTNGEVTQDEKKLWLSWPKNADTIHWKIKEHELSAEEAANVPVFLKKARAYNHPLNRFVRFVTRGRHPGFFIYDAPKPEKAEPDEDTGP